jgi:hypothetical protein
MRTLIAGEGPTELGDFAKEGPYRAAGGNERPKEGVIEALLERVAPGCFRIADGLAWKRIVKYRAGAYRKAEERNVMGLALYVRERGFEAAVFTRDRDREIARGQAIERGISAANATFGSVLAGGVAVEAIEAWLLALLEDRKAESHSDPKGVLEARGVAVLEEKVDVVRSAERERLLQAELLAPSFASWASRVRALIERPKDG